MQEPVYGIIVMNYLLTLAGASALTFGFPNGDSSQQIWLDSVLCVGTELTLASCPHQRVHGCTHAQDVGVRCLALEGKYSQYSTLEHPLRHCLVLS